ncbi:MAG: glycosyltransferase family 4 protein [Phycisphaerales bacterium]|nr:glycosyltransferase family 4 protein [Phycisphaerales bacterium]
MTRRSDANSRSHDVVEQDGRRAVVFLAPRGIGQHFIGLADQLDEYGHDSRMETLQDTSPVRVTDPMARSASVLVHAESVRARAVSIRRAGERHGVPVALIMDGVLEYANTFFNPGAGARFLRPAPADVVLAAGPHDAGILAALGNRAVGTGLPRLDAFRNRVIIAQATTAPVGVLVATANTPAFTIGGRARILASLRRIKEALARRRLPVRWRIAPDLAGVLGVERDVAPLAESVVWSRAVVTTASTLAIEAMIAGRPTAIVHPHPWPLWLPAAWLHRGDSFQGVEDDQERMRALGGADHAASAAAAESIEQIRRGIEPHETVSAGELIDSLLSPSTELIGLQNRSLDAACRSRGIERVARVLKRTTSLARATSEGDGVKLPGRADREGAETSRLATPSRGIIRVVSCIESHASSIGGVSVWSARMERHFAEHPELGIDWRTLFICPDEPPPTERVEARPRAAVCRLDPTDSPSARAAAVAQSLRNMGAEIVIPNYGELCYAACEVLRSSRRLRVVAVAHTNDLVYRSMLTSRNGWDAGVAVSEACAQWLRPLAAARPLLVAPYGVPFSAGREAGTTPGPLRLAYVGRVVEPQKRVSDLLLLLSALDRRGVDYTFEMVGDGEALADWQNRAASLDLKGRLRLHGPRDAEWVQRFWTSVDVNVIVSDAEGLSISMLESMAAGVVPCVTAVDAAVGGVVRDDDNGIAVPVGQMELMADRLAALARDRHELVRRSLAARRTIRDLGLTVESCASAWAGFLRSLPSTSDRSEVRSFSSSREPTEITASAEPDVEEPSLLRAVATLAMDGRHRIAVWAGVNHPRRTLEWIAANHRERVGAFIHPNADRRSTLMGVPCVPPAAAIEFGVDAVAISTQGGDLVGLAATSRLRRGGVVVAPVPIDARVIAQIDSVCAAVDRVQDTGGRVVTTLDSGVLTGATATDPKQWSELDRPELVVLRGDEDDFALYALAAPWRARGTIVRSLRFCDGELSSPERFAGIVASLAASETYAIYGGGLHTRRMLSHSGIVRQPVAILDDRAQPGQEVRGVRVVTMESLDADPPRVVVLSSPQHEPAMWARTAEWRRRGVRVLRLYESEQVVAGV